MRVGNENVFAFAKRGGGWAVHAWHLPPPHHITSLRPLSLRFSKFLMCSFYYKSDDVRWCVVPQQERSVAPWVGCCMH